MNTQAPTLRHSEAESTHIDALLPSSIPAADGNNRIADFPLPEKRDQQKDEKKARRLILLYEARHPGSVDTVAELKWVNVQLAKSGIPFTVTEISSFKQPTKLQSSNSPDVTAMGVGIIGAHGDMKLDHVHVNGYATGIDLSSSSNAEVKNTYVSRSSQSRQSEREKSAEHQPH